ncbi:MAG: F0F1 ATP synthase subunit epsilon [Acidobacteriota bacterium]|nr:F0F1 ATP synthase subunit epsilon [Acidobacteriota bacterium]MDH3786211.1 F0F1 ATP synthase subunit epsilon [Acidobacteriota bacterium]
MAETLQLEIVTPERRVLQIDVGDVIAPSVSGYLGVRPGHAALLVQLDVGEISYGVEGQPRCFLSVSGGFLEVADDRVSILAETSELAEEIDLERAERARSQATEVLDSQSSDAEFRVAAHKLRKALSRIQVRGRARR